MPSADALLGAATALLLGITGGTIHLIRAVTRMETLLRAHLDDDRAHAPPVNLGRRRQSPEGLPGP